MIQICELTISSKQGNGSTIGASTTSPPDAVNVVLRIVRVIIVEYVSDVADILIHKLVRLKDAEKRRYGKCNQPVDRV